MNPVRRNLSRVVLSSVASTVCVALVVTAAAAVTQQTGPASVELPPGPIRLAVGDRTTLSATVKDAQGNTVEAEVFFFSRARSNLAVDTRSGEFVSRV